MDRLADKYAEALDRYRRERPKEWNRLRTSVSLATDGHVIDLLRYVGLYGPQFQRDVLALVRLVWHRAMRGTDVPTPRLRDATAVMHDLADERTPEIYERVHAAKRAYLAQNQDWRPCTRRRGLVGCCAVLTCWNALRVRPDDSLCLNSLRYCWEHRGLALFNGLRHSPDRFCDACTVWNVLCLKITGGDRGHINQHIRTLQIPFVHRASGPLNLRVSWFLGPRGRLGRIRDASRALASAPGTWTRCTTSGRAPVPSIGPPHAPSALCPCTASPACATTGTPTPGSWCSGSPSRSGHPPTSRMPAHDGTLTPITDPVELRETLGRLPAGNPLLGGEA